MLPKTQESAKLLLQISEDILVSKNYKINKYYENSWIFFRKIKQTIPYGQLDPIWYEVIIGK